MGRKLVDLAPFENDMIDNLVAIATIDTVEVAQMNIDWIISHLGQGKVPIGIGLVLGDMLLLFEQVAAKLKADASN